jgi:peroxiredoxin
LTTASYKRIKNYGDFHCQFAETSFFETYLPLPKLLSQLKAPAMNVTLKITLISLTVLGSLLASGCDREKVATQQNEAATPDANVIEDTEDTEDSANNGASNPTVDAAKSTAPADVASKKSDMSNMAGMGKMKFPAPKDMKFKDSIESNVDAPATVKELVFTNKDGSKIKMADYLGQKNVILVFTEGFNGMLCPFCKTQTSRLVANYEKFQDRDCEVIVVYPGADDHLDEFIEAALKTEKEQVDEVPFPIVLDKDFKATDFFDIHSMHAHPSTYLIDKQGNVKFAYVGADMTADRPSVKALLNRLDNLK